MMPHNRETHRNYYTLLGISPWASTKEIQQRLLVLEEQYRRTTDYHPDPSRRETAREWLYLLAEAKKNLLDPTKRAEHDRLISAASVGNASNQPVQGNPCLKCGSVSGFDMHFCAECGSRLLKQCLECRTYILVRQGVCKHCNADQNRALKKKQQRAFELVQQYRNRHWYDNPTAVLLMIALVIICIVAFLWLSAELSSDRNINEPVLTAAGLCCLNLLIPALAAFAITGIFGKSKDQVDKIKSEYYGISAMLREHDVRLPVLEESVQK